MVGVNYFIGSNQVQKLYKGSQLIWENAPVVSRRWSLNLMNQWGDNITESGITWNNFKPSIDVTPGIQLLNLKTESNEVSALSFETFTAFAGAGLDYGSYSSSTPVYPITAVNSGIAVNYTDSTFRLFNCDINKKYKISALCVSNKGNSNIRMTIGGTSLEHIVFNNYPLDGANRYDNPALITMDNISPDSNGDILITFLNLGSYYVTYVNLLLIEEK